MLYKLKNAGVTHTLIDNCKINIAIFHKKSKCPFACCLKKSKYQRWNGGALSKHKAAKFSISWSPLL